jgi:putative transposase
MQFKHFNTEPVREYIENIVPELFKRKRKHNLWLIIEAIHYVMRTGAQWRMLGENYPPWQTVYYYHQKYFREGVWEQIHDALVIELRKQAGHSEAPTSITIDSQTNRSDAFVHEEVGFDAGKLTKGRKRHIAVDSQGLLLALVVHSAAIQDRNGFRELLLQIKSKYPTIKIVYADGGYSGPIAESIAKELGFEFRIVRRTDKQKKFQILPKRWVVERTFGWMRFYRRLNREYEHIIEFANAAVIAANTFALMQKLAKVI